MKVDFSANISMYRKHALNTARNAASEKAARKTDVAEFSRGNTVVSDKSLVGLKSAIQSELSSSTDIARINQLRQEVKNGTYRVSTRELVDAILNA